MKHILFLLFACIIPLSILILPIAGMGGIVGKLDWFSPFYIFTLQFAIGALLFVKLGKDFYRWLSSFLRCKWAQHSIMGLFIVTLISVFICLFYIEGQTRVQADESLYLTIAQNLYHNQVGTSCGEGVFENEEFECVNSITIKPRGLSYLYMLGMPFFGTDLYWVYDFQVFILFLTLPTFFFAILAWFRSAPFTLLSTALLANVPIFLFLSRSASIEGLYVFMFSLSLLFLKWAIDRNTIRHYLLLALTLAFLAQTRSEAVFCLFAFIGVVFARFKLSGEAQHSPQATADTAPTASHVAESRHCELPKAVWQSTNAKLASSSLRAEPVPCPDTGTRNLAEEFAENDGVVGEESAVIKRMLRLPKSLFSILHFSFSFLKSPFSTFLLTLSFFSIPVLCTLSINRDSDLQGGSLGAYGHLFENIIADFKIMAIENFKFVETLYYPYFPYFTWLALAGLVTLIVLVFREFKNGKTSLYRRIVLFILLLSPQYIILFDAISADINLDAQNRFVLIILPAMSFLGALFVSSLIGMLQSRFRRVAYSAILIAITANTLLYTDSFKQQNLYRNNSAISEQKEINKFLLSIDKEHSIFFSYTPISFLEKGVSSFSYNILLDVNKNIFADLQKSHDNVFFVENSSCKHSNSHRKMLTRGTTRLCDRTLTYFEADTALKVKLLKNRFETLTIYKILGLSDRDPNGFLRIMNKIEPNDSTVNLFYRVIKDTTPFWQIKHYVNDSLLSQTTYARGHFTDTIPLSLFNSDTNIWKLVIEDSITSEQIHSDFWQLIRVKPVGK